MLYKCDVNKNNDCPKTSCYIKGGECSSTFNERYKIDGTIGRTDEEVMNDLLKATRGE